MNFERTRTLYTIIASPLCHKPGTRISQVSSFTKQLFILSVFNPVANNASASHWLRDESKPHAVDAGVNRAIQPKTFRTFQIREPHDMITRI